MGSYVRWQENPDAGVAADRGIVRTLIRSILDAGHSITVDYGVDDWDELEVVESRDFTEIFNGLCATDSDVLRVIDDAGEDLGGVWLVYGNEPGVIIADYHLSLEPLVQAANERADKVMERF